MVFKDNESAEDYLETILILSKRLSVVRSIDVSNETGYKKSSVSVAMKNLREKQLITVDDNGYITLTDEGKAVANHVYERHIILSDLFVSLGVPEDVAAKDACRIEHILSPESYEALKKLAAEKAGK